MTEVQTSQANYTVTINDPAGKDLLIVQSLKGCEKISAPYEFVVECISSSSTIDGTSLLGTEAIVTFDVGSKKRYFCGVVGEVSQGQTAKKGDIFATRYCLKLYPTLWLLKFTEDCRIFQNQSALDIIKSIFSSNQLTKFTDKTTSNGQTVRVYCVQYNESAFNFVSRLMEEEGIWYYFEHTSSGHTLVLADANSAITAQPSSPVDILLAQVETPFFNQILLCHLNNHVVSNGFATRDYNYSVSTTPFQTKTTGDGVGGEVYSYPGLYTQSTDGDGVAATRIEGLEWMQETLDGTSTIPELTPGYSFTLQGHLQSSINKAYAAYEVHHHLNPATNGESPLYQNTFIAFDATTPFRPFLTAHKPRIYSTQTAIVTGKAGEEIWTDNYGRVCVQFHWDRLGSHDEKSSCMIRVAQSWAMGQWGILFTPRIGQEVVVSYLEGDPDRPLITGCVYNVDHMPPYLPAEPTKSTIKTNSSKGGGGYNELRFEDNAGSEQIYVQAEKDMDRLIKNNRTLTVNEGNDTRTIEKGSRIITFEAGGDAPPTDKLVMVKGDNIIELQLGNMTTTLTQGDFTTELTQGNMSTTLDQGNMDVTLSSGNETHTITGDMTFSATGTITIHAKSIVIQADQDVSIESGTSMTIQAGTSLNASSGTDATINGGANLNLEGSVNTTVKAGAMFKAQGSAGAEVGSSAMLTLKGEAMTNVQSPLIKLGGMVKIG